jgi:hypothetical protein
MIVQIANLQIPYWWSKEYKFKSCSARKLLKSNSDLFLFTNIKISIKTKFFVPLVYSLTCYKFCNSILGIYISYFGAWTVIVRFWDFIFHIWITVQWGRQSQATGGKAIKAQTQSLLTLYAQSTTLHTGFRPKTSYRKTARECTWRHFAKTVNVHDDILPKQSFPSHPTDERKQN